MSAAGPRQGAPPPRWRARLTPARSASGDVDDPTDDPADGRGGPARARARGRAARPRARDRLRPGAPRSRGAGDDRARRAGDGTDDHRQCGRVHRGRPGGDRGRACVRDQRARAGTARAGASLIHFSTDYVFDGTRRTPYDEAAPTSPCNVYGASKLEGERAIAASGAAALTFRTSWVYGRHGQNFLVTMQRLAATRDELRVVADQTGVPNWGRALARAIAALVARGPPYLAERAGLYHLSATGETTWYDFARAILGDRVRIVPITTADYPTPAKRPAYAVLDASRFARTFGLALPDWKTLLHACLAEPAEPAPAIAVP